MTGTAAAVIAPNDSLVSATVEQGSKGTGVKTTRTLSPTAEKYRLLLAGLRKLLSEGSKEGYVRSGDLRRLVNALDPLVKLPKKKRVRRGRYRPKVRPFRKPGHYGSVTVSPTTSSAVRHEPERAPTLLWEHPPTNPGFRTFIGSIKLG